MEGQHHKRGKFMKLAMLFGVFVLGIVIGGTLIGGARGGRGGWEEGPRGPMGWQQMPVAPQGPQVQPGAPQQFSEEQREWRGGPGFMPHGEQGFHGSAHMRGHWGPGGMHGRGGPGFIGGIFGLIGGLFKLVMTGLVIYLLAIVVRDRWFSRDKSDRDPPSAPQAPNTGMTTNL
jgi:hypothetical protein